MVAREYPTIRSIIFFHELRPRGSWGCRGHWDCRGFKAWKINTEDLGVIQFLEFSFILIFEKNIFLVELWNIMLHISTFSILLSCQLTSSFKPLIKQHFQSRHIFWSWVMKHATTTTNWKLKIWSLRRSVLGQSGVRQKYFRAKVLLGPKYSSGRNVSQAEVCFGPKWSWSQTGFLYILGPKALEMYKKTYTVYGVRVIIIYKDFYWKYDKIIPIETVQVSGKKLAESRGAGSWMELL